jgi:tetratricopeptide (TPR) repeat protein
LVPLVDAKGMSLWIAQAQNAKGALLTATGDPAGGIRHLSQALSGYRAIAATTLEPLALAALAEAHSRLGQTEAALQRAREARASLEKSGARWTEAETLRIEAEILMRSDVAEAERTLRAALAVARRQRARAWELRAAKRLARLLRDHGRPAQARATLEPVLGWFAEGLATRDLLSAQALLREIAA